MAGTGDDGFSGDSGPAVDAEFAGCDGVATDSSGNLYIADVWNNRVRRVAPNGTITTFAGTGTSGSSGVGGAATSAQLTSPNSLAVDSSGNVFIGEYYTHRVVMVDPGGDLTRVAGTGSSGFSGDGGPATSATLNGPESVAVDASGNLYIGDAGNHRIRKVTSPASGGTITTIVGTGSAGSSGDGSAATSAQINEPSSIAMSASGDLYIADWNEHRVRRIDGSSGVISTVAGTGSSGFSGDGGPAANAAVNHPNALAIDSSDNVYFTDYSNYRIRRIDDSDGTINTVVGTGGAGGTGDGGPAALSTMSDVEAMTLSAAGSLVMCDHGNKKVREVVNATSYVPGAGYGQITTVVGTGTTGFSGDTGPARLATLAGIDGVAFDSSGRMYIADPDNNRVRRVATNGTISTFAGTGTTGTSGLGGAATSAQLTQPNSLAVDENDNVYIGEYYAHRVLMVDSSGVITLVTGSGSAGYSGDGGAATSATVSAPGGLAVDSSGSLYIADGGNHVVRMVTPPGAGTRTISTVAGDGTSGTSGDGGAATSARLTTPHDVEVDSDDRLYIADYGAHSVRRVDSGQISTVVGGNGPGFSGDAGLATAAQINGPTALAAGPGGMIFVADSLNHRIRRVTYGVIETVVGTGTAGSSGDGGPAASAKVNGVEALVVRGSDLYIGDHGNRKVRRVVQATTMVDGVLDTPTMLAVQARLEAISAACPEPPENALEPQVYIDIVAGTCDVTYVTQDCGWRQFVCDYHDELIIGIAATATVLIAAPLVAPLVSGAAADVAAWWGSLGPWTLTIGGGGSAVLAGTGGLVGAGVTVTVTATGVLQVVAGAITLMEIENIQQWLQHFADNHDEAGEPTEIGDLGEDWVARPSEEIEGSSDCAECAAEIRHRLGDRGVEYNITANEDLALPNYRGEGSAWFRHTVVELNGRVYDAFGPRGGVPTSTWKTLWDDTELINWGGL